MGTEDYNKLIDYTNLAYTEYKEGTKLKLNLKTHEISVIEDFNENIKDEENEYFTVIKMQKNNSTGFSVMALKANKGEIVVTYKGSDFENTLDWEHNINNLPQEYLTNQGQEAILFLDKVLKENGEGNVIIVGHSLGGFLAQVAALNNIEYIDRINKVFAFDSPGFPTKFIKEFEDIIKEFAEKDIIHLLELTVVSQLMEQLPNITIYHVDRKETPDTVLFEAFSMHIIENFRKRISDDKLKFNLGSLEKEDSKFSGDILTNKAKSITQDLISYKDINTGFIMQITLSRENLDINRFLKKLNKNFYWNKGKKEIEKKINTKELKENPKYLVRGAILKCDKGSHMRRIDLRKCHGVYFKKGPVLHIEDCEVGEEKNIKSFGMCSCTLSECKPDILEEWLMGHEYTYIVRNEINLPCEYKDLLKALTENSFLVCANGGLIEPILSGQEYYEENEKDIIMINDNLAMEIK